MSDSTAAGSASWHSRHFQARAQTPVETLLESCSDAPGRAGRDRPRALASLAATVAETMIECEVSGLRLRPPDPALAQHPEFPVILAHRVLGGLHLLNALESSREAGLLAGLVARRLLLDGDVTEARDFAVLALDLASRTVDSHGALVLGVLAEALARNGHGEQAGGVHGALLELGDSIEAWRDIDAWAENLPWWDHASSNSSPSTPGDRTPRRPDYPGQCLRGSPLPFWEDPEWLDGMERFGLHRHRRLHGLTLLEATLLLHDLEDEAVAREWMVG